VETLNTEKPIDDMTKDELADYALREFGQEIDVSLLKKDLVVMVKNLAELAAKNKADADLPPPEGETEAETIAPPTEAVATEEAPQATSPAPVVVPPPSNRKAGVKYLRHPTNGRVFEADKHLLSRGDMIPCDVNGKTLPAE
jgi:hypothetical protein